ncbi:MAG: DNA polymerase/3'-5' exonuclease PolX [Phycisphaerales bacterium JB038]
MSANKELARIFSEMALAVELTGGNAFRVNALNRAARLFKDMTEDVAAVVEEAGEDAKKVLTAMDGVGKGTAERILEFLETGEIEEHAKLRAEVPAGLLQIAEIPGLGPKTVRLMWEQLDITTIEGLKQAIADESLLTLPRMGKKTVANIAEALEFLERSGGRTPMGLALPVAERIVALLEEVKGVKRAAYAGSLRRGRETVGDLDILVATTDREAAAVAFTTMPDVEKVLARGETKGSVRLRLSEDRSIQADLRLVEETGFESALLYFTGSKEHNIVMRERAIKRKLRLNEYGLFKQPKDPDRPPQAQGGKPVETSEAGIYTRLDLEFVPPELREEWVNVEELDTSELIEVADLKAELHAHTIASDGHFTIDELADQAAALGYHTVAVTDHSVSQPVANGLSPERLLEHIEAVREAASRRKDIRILAGSEVDILADGRLDYEDELLAQLDIVIASPHNALKQKPEVATKRLLQAIKHPLVHILGHPTGRLIGKRPGLEPDLGALIAAAVEHDTALEINAHWMRLDLRDTHVRAAAAAGCLIAINTDAHREEHLPMRRFGVATARRAGLPRSQCLNTWTKAKLSKWLKAKR